MCYRETQCTQYACGHSLPFTDSKVDCGSPRCRYSAQHVKPCMLGCEVSCKQWMTRAQPKVTQTSSSRCPTCLREQGMST